MIDDTKMDEEKAEAFADSFVETLNKGALCLMISIGHRTGLFDALQDLPPSTSHDIADKTGLNERYVREWLGAMVTGGILEVDPEKGTYHLPKEHSSFLTRQAMADNLAVIAQYIGLLGSVEDQIVHCFKNGGGVSYENYPRFHEVMAEDSGQSVLSSLESHIIPLIPGLKEKLEKGIAVVDIGCGRGKIMNQLAQLHPNSHFSGFDLSEEAISYAQNESSEKGLTNTTFRVMDLSDFDETAEPNAYDVVTSFDAIHDQAKPLNVLKGIFRTLKEDGIYLMQDIKGSSHVHQNMDHPIGPLLYTISCMHCMTVSLAQEGEGLGAMWGKEKACEYLEKAGFGSTEVNELDHDIQNYWYVSRKQQPE